MDFIFIDTETKHFQIFSGDNDRAKLIERNTKELQVVYPNVKLYYIHPSTPPKDELGADWKNNQGIYDSFILKFNQLGGILS